MQERVWDGGSFLPHFVSLLLYFSVGGVIKSFFLNGLFCRHIILQTSIFTQFDQIHLFLIFLNKEPVNKEENQQPPDQTAKPRADVSTSVPSPKANGPTEEQAEAKKNKRERKEERQKNRKKEKKELKLENSSSQKPKKCRKGQAEPEAGREEAPKANGLAGKKSKKKRGQEEQVTEEGAGTPKKGANEETKTAARKRKRKHSEGTRPSWGWHLSGQAVKWGV
jgi:cell growth-regulating nucleolar protein